MVETEAWCHIPPRPQLKGRNIMGFFVVLSLIVGAVGAVALPASASWAQPLDARPEAVLVGATLLVVASGLRRGFLHKQPK